jgi:hypothetical protein
MSEQPPSYAFPQRTPVFTALIVLIGILLFAWLVHRYYHPAPPLNPLGNPNPADFAEDQRWKMTPVGRAKALSDLRLHERTEAESYGVIDAKAGVYRVPIDRAIELIVQDHAKK